MDNHDSRFLTLYRSLKGIAVSPSTDENDLIVLANELDRLSGVIPRARCCRALGVILNDYFQGGDSFDRDPECTILLDELQALVDQPRKPAPPGGLSRKRYKELLHLWEREYPGKGEELMKLLAPFYSDGVSFRPEPPQDGLAEKCQESVFWRPFVGIRVVDETNFEVPTVGLKESLSTYLGPGFDADFAHNLHSSLAAHINLDLLSKLSDSGFENRQWDSHKGEEVSKLGQVDEFRESLFKSLASSVFYACACKIAGQETFLSTTGPKPTNFLPLLKLWRFGNLPFGFDVDDNLLVLCAKA